MKRKRVYLHKRQRTHSPELPRKRSPREILEDAETYVLQNLRTTLRVENEIALSHDHLGARAVAGELHMENGEELW